ncbi:hypothetical protein H112_08498 [Trichophyton rubrum D6]|uniref:Uncharacterized protein n=3 Tax=Trichophyton TaxID=5550 RepID=F2SER2_TRIRC|nr:uncharacterized protein TERG_01059 [Trichophyton rubrum CBS 118892]XP_047605326.1 uncharacterized protein TERG_01059 [Trichophyton rubrum CBS 118892]EZF10310.1 hypothetical protein H100_08520 [Trichophyton rubrum MR850]EZF37202.1 hypothetical protein H102_08480 [Trichophyton rubrum CBS 100081]EZF47763.1 hypothetical protein H103_08501 [Trichophyton rubrum CBS 288.86]EZF68960.1 hypothetical protein H105_08508 [Trichophyton soudanense CBS 452.61]EZG01017.1 hypothetical protein H106_08379 [Tr
MSPPVMLRGSLGVGHQQDTTSCSCTARQSLGRRKIALWVTYGCLGMTGGTRTRIQLEDRAMIPLTAEEDMVEQTPILVCYSPPFPPSLHISCAHADKPWPPGMQISTPCLLVGALNACISCYPHS